MDEPLKIKFPQFFRLDSAKDSTISEKWVGDVDFGTWSVLDIRLIIGSECITEWTSLNTTLLQVKLQNTEDSWAWFGLGIAPFSVKAVKRFMQEYYAVGDW